MEKIKKNLIKTLILAGGFGTRLSEYTYEVPKPMVPIGKIPIIIHLMNLYSNYGFNDFIIATGYKSDVINNYFIKNADKIIKKSKKELSVEYAPPYFKEKKIWNIEIIFTGKKTLTGSRILKVKKKIGNNRFMLTYGDGISNVNLKNLLKFHIGHKKIATMTAVRPPVRFGELEIKKNKVTKFEEKPKLQKGWINGGFFVLEKEIFKYLSKKNEMFEKKPLEKIVKDSNLMAFCHSSFWQCMDSKRDKDYLEKIWLSKKVPWIKK